MPRKASTFLRWVGVVPAALGGVVIGTLTGSLLVLILQLFFRSNGEGEIQGIVGVLVTFVSGRTLTTVVQNFFYPFAAIWFGSRMAPALRLQTAYGLAILFLLVLGASTFAVLLPRSATFVAPSPVEAGITLLFGVLGCVQGVRLIAQKEREGFGSGWKSWLGVTEPSAEGEAVRLAPTP